MMAGIPFFPRTVSSGDRSISEGGIDLRDWFAGQVIAGILSMHANPSSNGFKTTPPEQMVKDAYAIADLMLAERQKGGEA